MTFDDAYIKEQGLSDACLCIFTDLQEGQEVTPIQDGQIKALEDAVRY